MKQTTITIEGQSSERLDFSNLILSVRETHSTRCVVVIGCPGLPNVIEDMRVGDAVLFETHNEGIFEIRVLSMDVHDVQLLISHISPRLGIVGGFIDDDPNNTPFTSIELDKIAESIKRIRADVDKIQDVTPEQINIISRKLSDIQDSSQRFGRKDWINYVVGTLTNLCVAAAFAPETSKALFKAVNSAFRWLFDNALILLS